MEKKKAKTQGARKVGNEVTAGRESTEIKVKAEDETVARVSTTDEERAEKAATATEAGADVLSNGYDRYLAQAKEQLERVLPEAVGKFDEVASFGKGNVDAFFKAGDVAAKALETVGNDLVALNRRVWDDGIANTRALLGCKTFEEVVELQTTVARGQFERLFADSAKLGEMSLKTASQAIEPISARVNEAIDRFAKPVTI